MASCATCGQRLPKASRYCPSCGKPVGDGATKVLELPRDETGCVPVQYARTERRYYGVTPTAFAVALAAAAGIAAVVLFAAGRWPVGLIFLGVGSLLLLASPETRVFRHPSGVAAD